MQFLFFLSLSVYLANIQPELAGRQVNEAEKMAFIRKQQENDSFMLMNY